MFCSQAPLTEFHKAQLSKSSALASTPKPSTLTAPPTKVVPIRKTVTVTPMPVRSQLVIAAATMDVTAATASTASSPSFSTMPSIAAASVISASSAVLSARQRQELLQLWSSASAQSSMLSAFEQSAEAALPRIETGKRRKPEPSASSPTSQAAPPAPVDGISMPPAGSSECLPLPDKRPKLSFALGRACQTSSSSSSTSLPRKQQHQLGMLAHALVAGVARPAFRPQCLRAASLSTNSAKPSLPQTDPQSEADSSPSYHLVRIDFCVLSIHLSFTCVCTLLSSG